MDEVWDRYMELVHSDNERTAIRATTWFLNKKLTVDDQGASPRWLHRYGCDSSRRGKI
jgi:hypothetical protein